MNCQLFYALRWPIYGTALEIKKKKKKEKRITKHGRHYSSYRKKKTKKKPIIEWEMGRIASMAALKKKRKRS